ncbi:photosystem II assembly protein Psb35 [Leptolyngbya sp. O-77]|uniref:photosystem II assembly protein Psb35 n=1 Tax=Leptolyngbya sp. O-77 TaxID=1080068 RepID=UPI0018D41768|nr:hypothetical protein [Leptolyngbya sp. O-77]
MLNVLSINALLLVEPAVSAAQDGAGISLAAVFVVGFLAAAGLGSIAWYNSRRPTGWENKERPDVVPEVDPNPHV